MDDTRNKVLVLAGHGSGDAAGHSQAVEALRCQCDIVEANSVAQAIELLRREPFSAVLSDAGDFLPLERAMVSQQASLILNTIGEGVCIVDGEGRCTWMNNKMGQWPPRVHDKIRATCREAFELFSKQVSPQNADSPATFSRSKRYSLSIEEQQFMEMIASPVIDPSGTVMQVVAVVWDARGDPAAAAEDRRHRPGRARTGAIGIGSDCQDERGAAAEAAGGKNRQLHQGADALRPLRHTPARPQIQQA